jgi:hypothetical protein
MKNKMIRIFKKLPKSIVLGFLDALMPNIKESIKEKESEFYKDLPTLDIDWTRLTTALVSFTLIVLAIFDFITAEDIIKLLTAWNF